MQEIAEKFGWKTSRCTYYSVIQSNSLERKMNNTRSTLIRTVSCLPRKAVILLEIKVLPSPIRDVLFCSFKNISSGAAQNATGNSQVEGMMWSFSLPLKAEKFEYRVRFSCLEGVNCQLLLTTTGSEEREGKAASYLFQRQIARSSTLKITVSLFFYLAHCFPIVMSLRPVQ